MKPVTTLLTSLMAVALLFTACAKKSEVNTAPLERSFATADAPQKGEMEKATAAIHAGNYAEAMASLQKLAAEAKLTPEQQQAVKDVMAQVQQKLSDTLNRAAGDAQKSMDDLKKSLPK